MYSIDLKDDDLEAALNRLLGALGDQSQPMARIGEYLIGSTKDRFQQGVSPDGTPWAPKSPTTLERYRRNGDPADPRPLFGPTKRLSSEIFKESGPDFVSIGSNAIQAAVMQLGAAKGSFGTASNGSPLPWGDIPARPFLGISDEDRSAIIEIVEEWLQDAADD